MKSFISAPQKAPSSKTGANSVAGTVKSIRRFDSGYAIVQLATESGMETLTGDIGHLSEGIYITAHVEEFEHAKYGVQFKVIEIKESGFNNLEGLAKYLTGSSFSGIGIASARLIVNFFSEECDQSPDRILKLIDENPDVLLDIPGLSKPAAQKMVSVWAEVRQKEKDIGEIMSLGLGRKIAKRVIEELGDHAVGLIHKNPYILTSVSGIGFPTADEIALKKGTPRDSIERAGAAVVYIMDQSKMSGHCYLNMNSVANKTVELLNNDVNHIKVSQSIKVLVSRGELKQEDDRVYLTTIYYAEKQVAAKLRLMLANQGGMTLNSKSELELLIKPIEHERGIQLAEEQKDALASIVNSRICIITGGPGTGKSTLTYAAIKLLEHFGLEYVLCSPTGMAAKRLAKATEQEAATIHRLLGFKNGAFTYNEQNTLTTDCAMVDESSMLDISLFRSLLDALEDNDRLILIGDVDQLPSVGPGNVLKDLIESGLIPVVRLQTIFRQALGSQITVSAHDILKGQVPDLPSPKASKGKNCMFVGAEDPKTLSDYILKLVGESLPKAGFKPEDIQVLTPMRGKGLGVDDLNPRLQNLLNPATPDKAEVSDNFRVFRVGDRVMQTKNDYNKNVFNGFVGRVVGITRESSSTTMFVEYPDMDELVEYCDDWDHLQLAYAKTVHKSQGSEYPAVILVMHPSHRNMLQKNLLYTGLTRAKKLCVIAGTVGAIETAVNNNRESLRNTTLRQLLQKPN